MQMFLLVIAIIIIDQLAKYYVQTNMSLGNSIPVIDKVFHITYILNPGAAFGILENQTAFFIAVALVMFAAVFYYYPRIPAQFFLLRLGIGLMIGGAIGNLIDRIKSGSVVDFFDFRIWPVFNIADIAIVTGVSCIIFHILYLANKEDDVSE